MREGRLIGSKVDVPIDHSFTKSRSVSALYSLGRHTRPKMFIYRIYGLSAD